MEAWGGIELDEVATAGDLEQLYPNWVTPGVNKATAVHGDQIRQPLGGQVLSVQVQTDGTSGGVIELWDFNGQDAGADVSSAVVITNAQLTTAIAQGNAKLMWRQDFSADAGARTASARVMPFVHGLAARYTDDGTPGAKCYLNLVVDGGYEKLTKVG